MACAYGNSRYLNTVNASQQGLGRRQPLRVIGTEIDDKTNNGLFREVAAANPEPANFDQAGQFARRPHQLPLVGIEMHAIVADQHRRRDLPRAPGQDKIEREPRFARS